jgi:hypothetical protein
METVENGADKTKPDRGVRMAQADVSELLYTSTRTPEGFTNHF